MCYRVSVVLLVIILIASGCKPAGNREPDIILISAPDTVQSKTPFEIKLRVVDPENDIVKVRLDFGDSYVSEYSEFKPSGTIFSFTHVYTATGDFNIYAYAEDSKGSYTGWRFLKRITVR
ncbi:MAG: PKD domain-containing protein [candidate division WOR-3 bacterium]